MSTATKTKTKYVYEFSEGSKEMKDLLGGKGANVAEMTRILGVDLVPRGFTITTEACIAYMRNDGKDPAGLDDEMEAALERLQEQTGRRFGDPDDPLLVSVRSGARESMPGMMDTVLNLGLNDESVKGLTGKTGNERFAWDSYRRLVQMFGNVVRGVEGERFEGAIQALKEKRGVALDTELDAGDLEELTEAFKEIYRKHTGEDFPQDPAEQLRHAIHAVFDSWNTRRAIEYRRIHHIPDDWGTAVNVQQMVFGNRGETSGSGVAFTRDENTGAPEPSGDFLTNAQGEDVVSGARNTQELGELAGPMPEVHAQLVDILRKLERDYKDMQDVEFTIEEGKLYMLQTRDAKRPAQAAVRVAVDMVNEGLIEKAEAIMNIDAERLDALLHPTFDSKFEYAPLARGVAASPGAAKGEIVFTADEAVERAERGDDVILVRPFTEADDVHGFHAAKGVLTAEGGKASHAALVARGMGVPCVAGASALKIDLEAGTVSVNGRVLNGGDHIAIDGSTGAITDQDVPLVDAEMNPNFETVLEWADELRRLGVRTNADTPEDASRARSFGAQGIGLCRTEHMFMATDRQAKMKEMIMAETEADRRRALDDLLPLQQADFEGIFEAMSGLPVTIRLLDPPLHEFLPNRIELEVALVERNARGEADAETVELKRELERVKHLEEVNPMLGTRGCRLGILYPEVYEMQVRAILRAAIEVQRRTDATPQVEIMIPLVDYAEELERMRKLVDATAEQIFAELGAGEEAVDYLVGTMIELPRACLVGDLVAAYADFFSFGTNDLTQTALGLSRDDVEAKFLADYLELKIVDRSPFETIDVPGVGRLVEIGVERGRSAKPGLKVGICGEHGGDPTSIRFFDRVGLDYVSCSPFRVPIARVAAAQAAIAGHQ